MPPVIVAAAVGAAAGGLGLFTGLAIAGSFALGGAVVFGGLALVSSLLAPKLPQINGAEFGGLAADNRRMIRQAVTNARWVLGYSRISGVLVYYLEPEDNDRDLHMMLVLCEGPIQGIIDMFVDGERVEWEGNSFVHGGSTLMRENAEIKPIAGHKWHDHLTVRCYYNGAQAAQALRDVSGSQWSSDHVLTNKACVHVHLKQSDYGNNVEDRVWFTIPNLEFLVKGLRIQRPDRTQAEWVSNVADLRWWWLTQRRGVPDSAIDRDSYLEARRYCAALISNSLSEQYLTAGYAARQPRYEINGVLASGDNHDQVEQEMDFCWAGNVVEVSGTHYFRPGRDDNIGRPIPLIGETEIISRERIQPAPALTDRVNAMTMRLAQSNVHDFTEAAIPEFVDAEGEQRDGSKLSVDLGTRPYVCCPVAGGRLMATLVRRARAFKQYTYRISPGDNLERMSLIPSDLVTLHDPELAIVNVRCVVVARRVNPDWSIDLTLQQQLDGTHADSTILPPLFAEVYARRGLLDKPNAPTSVAGSARVTVADDGTAKSVITITWDKSPHRTYCVVSGPSEQPISNVSLTREVTGTELQIEVPYPGSYQVTVQHRNNKEVLSDAVTIEVRVSWADLPIGGQVWRSGAGAPDNSLGFDGDFYLDTTSKEIYLKINGAWVLQSNIAPADGAQWLSGTGAPSNSLGSDGDWYFREGTGATAAEIYQKINGVWVLQIDIDQGQDGSTWHSGEGEPGANLGKISDFYFRTANGYVYEKTGQATWTFRRDITGPAGINGSTWHSVSGVPNADVGVDGDFALDVNNNEAYQKVNGAWVKRVDFSGADGAQWYSGTGVPRNSLGNEGDWYFREGSGSTAAEIYQKINGLLGTYRSTLTKDAMVLTALTVGTAQRGIRAATVPSGSLGDRGDFYFRTT